MTHVSGRSTRWLLAVLAALTLAALMPADDSPTSDELVSVIVRGEASGLDAIRLAVESLGGEITLDLPIIDGFSADVPASGLEWLSAQLGVTGVSEDVSVSLHGRPPRDLEPLPMAELTDDVLGLDRLWRRGVTGEGIGVALIDSGVAPVDGLDAEAKILNGPDLSFDSPFPGMRHLDAYGHGTHLAGIIAGADPALGDGLHPRGTAFSGVAPGAHIINVKVADGLGSADVSQVIAGIQWVVAHKDDPGVNIEVLNLAFGTDSAQDYRIDPLSHAVEQAWHAGITVVVATGNDGNDVALRNPASNPFVISVGATDPGGTRRVSDDAVLEFSNCGVDDRPVDVLAPGRSLASLRVPGSYVDTTYPEAAVRHRFFLGTGTSQAAAVASGLVALMLDADPDLSPDEVKARLSSAGHAIHDGPDGCREATVIDPSRAVRPNPHPSVSEQSWDRSDGSGSLEAARGSYHVFRDGVALTGETDILGNPWPGGTWSGGTWSGGTWSGGTWSGGTWSGGTWSGCTWSGGTWSVSAWN